MPSMEALATEGMALMAIDKVYTEDGYLESARCERCIILFDVDTMLTVGDWLLCEDCYEDL